MATLEQLCNDGIIVAIDPLEPDELGWRRLYATPDFITWLDQSLPVLHHNPLYTDLTPLEQVFATFSEYVAGENFASDRRFKKLSWTPDQSVWEFKTDEVRIFGWIPCKDSFICCYGDSKDTVVTLNLVGRYIAQTSRVRQLLDLDEPKYVNGHGYNDVISAKD